MAPDLSGDSPRSGPDIDVLARTNGHEKERQRYLIRAATILRRPRVVDRVPDKSRSLHTGYEATVEEWYPKGRGKPLDRITPPLRPYKCHEGCGTCFSMYFPARIHVTDARALLAIQRLSTSFQTDLAAVRDVLTHHADVIVSR